MIEINQNLQLKRLKKRHSECFSNIDLIQFLDLTHVLRILSEYKDELFFLENSNFSSVNIRSKLNKLTNKPKLIIFPADRGVLHSTFIAGSIFYCGESLPDDVLKEITSSNHNFHKTKYSSDKFWNTHIMYVRIKEGEEIIPISRLELVQRTANTLGASHKFNKPDNESSEIDIAINLLFKELNIFGIPGPFFMCYKIAQEILTMTGHFEYEKTLHNIEKKEKTVANNAYKK